MAKRESKKLVVVLKMDYNSHKAGKQLTLPYNEASKIINSGGAKLLGYPEEVEAKKKREQAKTVKLTKEPEKK